MEVRNVDKAIMATGAWILNRDGAEHVGHIYAVYGSENLLMSLFYYDVGTYFTAGYEPLADELITSDFVIQLSSGAGSSPVPCIVIDTEEHETGETFFGKKVYVKGWDGIVVGDRNNAASMEIPGFLPTLENENTAESESEKKKMKFGQGGWGSAYKTKKKNGSNSPIRHVIFPTPLVTTNIHTSIRIHGTK
ncbi:hypothetical protein FACS189472_11910 [Alphaproteobacteria bacterium]|nr:hypothetical protein FACS189472_11910 [Alphaproteobacteria bacterium]